mmetsp:Transcript_44576/g.51423  ORF Transcript_44576/g.51423 Transcript_44576/m.51423 type:complete len:80 (-) Transcript_44576:1699-1938(-)
MYLGLAATLPTEESETETGTHSSEEEEPVEAEGFPDLAKLAQRDIISLLRRLSLSEKGGGGNVELANVGFPKTKGNSIA